jgi:hypothetical protein
MVSVVKLLLTVGIGAGVFGALLIPHGRTARGPLPGDMIIRPGDFVFYSPLGLSIVLSVALAILNLYLRR